MEHLIAWTEFSCFSSHFFQSKISTLKNSLFLIETLFVTKNKNVTLKWIIKTLNYNFYAHLFQFFPCGETIIFYAHLWQIHSNRNIYYFFFHLLILLHNRIRQKWPDNWNNSISTLIYLKRCFFTFSVMWCKRCIAHYYQNWIFWGTYIFLINIT